jgi:hypothetical protein
MLFVLVLFLNSSVLRYLYQCFALINRFYAICISALLEFVSFALFTPKTAA